MFSGLKIEDVVMNWFRPKKQFQRRCLVASFFLAMSHLQLITKKKWESLSDNSLKNESSTWRRTVKPTDILFELIECVALENVQSFYV